MSFEGEKIFYAKQQIKYVFIPTIDCDYLVVGFSGFAPVGSPPKYNYLRTLENVEVNKLFILDDQGERGSYYLGKNRVFDVEESVLSLIISIADKYNIKHKNIICCGSSKGGYASLYFGIKYGFGHIIAGAPQTYLGNYLKKMSNTATTLEFIAGDKTEENVHFLNKLLYDVVDNVKKIPNTYIQVGNGDHHYKGHVLPFVDYLKKRGFECVLDVCNNNNHGDVSFYKEFLLDKLIEIIPNLHDVDVLRIRVEVNQIENKFIIKTKANKQAQFAWYVIKNGERIETKWYIPESIFKFEAKEPGIYHFVAFAQDQNGNKISKKTKQYHVEF